MGGLSPSLEARLLSRASPGCLDGAGGAGTRDLNQDLASCDPRGPSPTSRLGHPGGTDMAAAPSPSPPGAFSHPGNEIITEAGESSLLFLPKAAKGQGTGGSWPQPLSSGPLAPGLAHLGNGILPGQCMGGRLCPALPLSPSAPTPGQGSSVSWLSPASCRGC